MAGNLSSTGLDDLLAQKYTRIANLKRQLAETGWQEDEVTRQYQRVGVQEQATPFGSIEIGSKAAESQQ